MTTNKPKVEAYLHIAPDNLEYKKVRLHRDGRCPSTLTNAVFLIRLSDYQRLQADHERLQAECEKLIAALKSCAKAGSAAEVASIVDAALAAYNKNE